MELYPKISNYKRVNLIAYIMFTISIMIGGASIVVNFLTDTTILWSLIVIIGIIHTWVTVITSIRSNINIVRETIIQLVAISVICFVIDWITKYRNWSIDYAIPITIITANTIVFLLTIINHKKHAKYFRYEIIVFLLSLFPGITMILKWNNKFILPIISLGINLLTLFNVLIVCRKEIITELKKIFHM